MKLISLNLLTSLVLLAICACCSAASEIFPLKLDFCDRADMGPESGFLQFSEDDNGKTSYNGIKITARRYMDGKFYPTTQFWRARSYVITDNTTGPRLWKTLLQGGEGYGLEIKVEGLAAASCYRLSIFAWDYDSLQSMTPRVADWTANGQYLFTSKMGNKELDLSQQMPVSRTDYISTGYACSDSEGKIILQAAKGSTNNSLWFAFINALVIEEPVIFRRIVPANGQKNVPLDIQLRWSFEFDSEIAAIDCVYLYLTCDIQNWDLEPVNIPLERSASTEQIFLPAGLESNTTYYWRVDRGVIENGITSMPEEPNTILGDVWSFQTE